MSYWNHALKLTIVIPALDEEKAIGQTIERCLAARRTIIAESPVDDVEIIVVDDGSTDRTSEVARRYGKIRLINFEHNRGYGAAIKRGFDVGTGELVGFMDADGTCNPVFFATLCTALVEDRASVAVGSRMGPDSRMPGTRRVGNRIYALILSILSNQVVTDAASGMRVVRRDALGSLYPLPDGLHFTPAMTTRALMDGQLRIVERPMSYDERVGESKLHVLRDGVIFLRTILEMTLVWRPARLFFMAALVGFAATLALAAHPIETWLTFGRLDRGLIHRLLFCSVLGTGSAALLGAGVLSHNICRLLDRRHTPTSFWVAAFDRVFTYKGLFVAAVIATAGLAWLVGPGAWSWLTGGHVDVVWPRVVLAALIVFVLAQMSITALLAGVLRFHVLRRSSGGDARIAEQASASTKSVGTSLPAPSPVGRSQPEISLTT
ncbi:MAG: glycosyltransferase family 2 protein [Phycisphaerae bacterium]